MTPAQIEAPFRCGLDGTEWRAWLTPVGPRLRFGGFRRPGERTNAAPISKAMELRQRLRDLSTAKPPLPPPAASDIVHAQGAVRLTEDQITDFGFACPSCQDTALLICPVCHKLSCQAARDAAERVLCQWCGSTLVFGRSSRDESSARRPAVEIDVSTERREIRTRELPPGS